MDLRSQRIITIRVLWVNQLQLKVLLLFPYFKVELLVLGGLNREPLMSHIWNEEGKVLSNFMLIHKNKCEGLFTVFQCCREAWGDQRIKYWALNSCCFYTKWILLHTSHSWFFFWLLFLLIKWSCINKKKRFSYQAQNILPPAIYFASQLKSLAFFGTKP